MTGQDIYVLSSALLWESDNEDRETKAFTVQHLNQLLPEALGVS